MIGFGALVKYIALIGLLSGVFVGLISSALIIVQNPTEKSAYINASRKVGGMIFNSQNDIVVSMDQLNKSINAEEAIESSTQYQRFLLFRILADSLVTLGIMYFIYKGLSWLVPASGGDLGARLIILSLSVGGVWFVSLVYSLSTGNGWIMPFNGWAYAAQHAGILQTGLNNAGYSVGTNVTQNFNKS